jgi:outer membrane cobalamin receptor
MRRYHRMIAGLSLLATAACAADSVAGPQAVPAPEILLRGPRSAPGAYNQPLYVVDGVVRADDRGLEDLDSADITHIHVVRGAPAIAKYGPRGEHGVIVITTRRAPVKALNDTQ